MEYDPLAPEVLADPFPAYAELRERCPVHRSDAFGHPLYTLSRRRDVHDVLVSPERWSNALGAGVGYGRGAPGNVQHFDPPEHAERRRFLRDEFLPIKAPQHAERTYELARRLADELEAAGPPAELHDAYAMALPIIQFVEMLGVEPGERERIKRWADELVLALADPRAGAQAGRELRAFVRALVEQRRAAADAGEELPPGLLSTWSVRELRGERLPLEEMGEMVLQLMVAGHETTTSLITNLVFRLLERRERWEQVLADPSLAEAAVEESLRFDPPVLGLCRTNTEPVELGGQRLEPDTKVMLLYASANRDPELFDDPDEFRLDRGDDLRFRHYSFGRGIHLCLGAPLARQTGRIALEVLLERFPTLRLAGETERLAPAFLWGRRRLPVAW